MSQRQSRPRRATSTEDAALKTVDALDAELQKIENDAALLYEIFTVAQNDGPNRFRLPDVAPALAQLADRIGDAAETARHEVRYFHEKHANAADRPAAK